MANVYADTFLKSPQGIPYTLRTILDSKISVEEIAFNATEFRTGVAFRFQKSTNDSALIGNGNVSIPKESAKDIRLADIVAASSCFPGGFEPMDFLMILHGQIIKCLLIFKMLLVGDRVVKKSFTP
ncbi:MAG: patatin-like phospholipase family protein [Leptolyngbyaceae cyanobacterium SU_3_3]|nr:patatin-like phospholipase family protein [Leptolyngbyaceae cyanobacterium SU_3_3]